MTENESRAPQTPGGEKPLEGWKEIAAYLKRVERTVKRWEKSEDLPVRRHLHQARASVYAYPSELDVWLATRQPAAEEPAPWYRRPAPSLALAAVLLVALLSAASGPLVNPPGILAQSAAPAGMVVRQAWAGPDADASGAPSPDGRYLSFANWEVGNLAIRNLAAGKNRDLTTEGTWDEPMQYAHYSIWAPDGQQIAYAWFNKDRYELRVIRVDDNAPRVLYRNESQEIVWIQPAAWAGTGNYILTLFRRTDGTNQIVRVSLADGSVQIIKSLDWRYPVRLSLSTDDRYIAYDVPEKQASPERDIFLLAADGSREIPLVEHPANDFGPVWALDGNTVLFASDRAGTVGAWALEVRNGAPRGAAKLVKADMGRLMVPMGLTPKGSYYYGLSTFENAGDVYIARVDPAIGSLVGPPQLAIQKYLGSNTSAGWSPDGKYLAYLSKRGPVLRGDFDTRIVIRALATGEERELAVGLPRIIGVYGGIKWSPDGRSLLVVGTDTKGRYSLYRIDVQTGGTTPIVREESGRIVYWHAWSPEGKSVYFVRRDFEQKIRHIVVRDLETGREKEILRTAWSQIGRALALSPDGRQVAYILSEPAAGSTSLYIVPAAAGAARELLKLQGPHAFAGNTLAWTQDGSQLLFGKTLESAGQEQETELWRIPAEGGEPRPLGLAILGLRDLRVHPDGKQIAFTAGQDKAEVWVLENFLPEPEVAEGK